MKVASYCVVSLSLFSPLAIDGFHHVNQNKQNSKLECRSIIPSSIVQVVKVPGLDIYTYLLDSDKFIGELLNICVPFVSVHLEPFDVFLQRLN